MKLRCKDCDCDLGGSQYIPGQVSSSFDEYDDDDDGDDDDEDDDDDDDENLYDDDKSCRTPLVMLTVVSASAKMECAEGCYHHKCHIFRRILSYFLSYLSHFLS